MAMTLRTFFFSALVVVFAASALAQDSPKTEPAGKITFLKGTAEVSRGGKSITLGEQQEIYWGDTITTGKSRSRLEIRLNDGSFVRLAQGSKLVIEKAAFGSGERNFSAEIKTGKLYALAAKVAGEKNTFQVKTSTAVAGVRGTTFRIDAKKDGATVVRVYAGAVAVSNAPVFAKKAGPAEGGSKKGVKPGGPGRVEVPGPHEVSRREWEEIVAQAMQEIKVSADGRLGPAVAFDAEKDAADEWVAWNKARDAEVK
jgi:hypothetical protein